MKIEHRYFFVIALATLGSQAGMDTLAQALRDPTKPPAGYGASGDSTRLPGDAFKPEQLLTVDDVRFVVWNSRRYAVGEMIDGARIERISDSEVWLQSANGVRKISLFSGIDKRLHEGGLTKKPSTPVRVDEKNGLSK